MVTGLLSAVGNLMVSVDGSIASLSWTAPFSLDIPEDPDIMGYCVDVYGSDDSLIFSLCGINETALNYTLPSDYSDYTFTVTPVNVVGNGSNSSVPYSGQQ